MLHPSSYLYTHKKEKTTTEKKKKTTTTNRTNETISIAQILDKNEQEGLRDEKMVIEGKIPQRKGYNVLVTDDRYIIINDGIGIFLVEYPQMMNDVISLGQLK